MIFTAEYKGKNVEIFYAKKSETDYVRLAKCLLKQLTQNQFEKIIQKNGTQHIIFFDDLYKQFIYKGLFNTAGGHCICGVPITNQYKIQNNETNEEFIVGSVCKDNWCVHDGISYYCVFCDRRKTSKENCVNCQGKITLRRVFKQMKTLIEKVDFGMYANKMSYYKLVETQPSYCKWLVNASNINISKKEKIKALLQNLSSI